MAALSYMKNQGFVYVLLLYGYCFLKKSIEKSRTNIIVRYYIRWFVAIVNCKINR